MTAAHIRRETAYTSFNGYLALLTGLVLLVVAGFGIRSTF